MDVEEERHKSSGNEELCEVQDEKNLRRWPCGLKRRCEAA